MNKIQNDYTLKQNPLRLLDPALLVIAILPWLLLAVHPNWIFPGVGGDSLFTWGLFHTYDIKIPLTDFNSSHYYTRLSAIFPGYVIFHLFPALEAVYVLNFVYWYTTVFSIYWTIKIVINQRAALLASVLMGSYTMMLSSFSSGAIDGPAICYLALTLLFLTLAAEKRFSKAWLVASGFFFAAAVHCYFFVLCLTPIFMGYYFFVNRESKQNKFGWSLVFVFIGFLVCTIVLGIIHFSAGGQFLFFWPQMLAAVKYSHRAAVNNPALQPLHITLIGSRHLVLPILIFIGGLCFLWLNRVKNISKTERLAGILQLLYMCTMAIYVFFEIRGNISPLWYQEIVSFALPVMFIAFGAQLKDAEKLTQRSFWFLTCVVIVFVALLAALRSFSSILTIPNPPLAGGLKNAHYDPDFSGKNLLFLLIGAGGLLSFYSIKNKYPLCAFLAIFFSLGVIFANQPYMIAPRLNKEQFIAVDKARKVIETTPEYYKQHRQRFWIDSSSPISPVYRAIAAIFQGGYDSFYWPEPNFNEMPDTFKLQSINAERGRPKSGEVLLIMTDKRIELDHAKEMLHPIGLTARLLKREMVKHGSIFYFMSFIKLEELTVSKE